MDIKKVFSTAMLVVGAIIGAGFASGKEIVQFLFDGQKISVLTIIIVTLILFCYIIVFLSLNVPHSLSESLFGKRFAVVGESLLLMNSLIITSSMMSCMTALLRYVTPLNFLGSIVISFVVLFFVCKGLKWLMALNNIVVPLIIIFVIILSFMPGSCEFDITAVRFSGSVLYSAMNLVLTSCMLVKQEKMSKKESVLCAGIASVIIGILLVLLSSIMLKNSSFISSEMPLVSIIFMRAPSLIFVAILVVLFSVISTLVSSMYHLTGWLGSVTGERTLSGILSTAICLSLSIIGFDSVVAFLYPVVACFGIVFCALATIKIIRQNVAKDMRKTAVKSSVKPPL